MTLIHLNQVKLHKKKWQLSCKRKNDFLLFDLKVDIPPVLGGSLRLYLNSATWITGVKIQAGHGKDSKHGLKTLKIYYSEGKNQMKLNEKIVSKIYSTDDWEEIPKDLNPDDNVITLNKKTTAPIVFKFAPILTDQIRFHFLESHKPSHEIYINELELHNDCKLKLVLCSKFVNISVLDYLQHPGKTTYLTHRDGRSFTTNNDGSFNTIPAEVFSQFKVEIVEVATTGGGGVRFRNNKGEYLTENLSWSKTASSEQIFQSVKHGEFQAFKNLQGEYLSLKDDGSLEMSVQTIPSLSDAQLFQDSKGKSF